MSLGGITRNFTFNRIANGKTHPCLVLAKGKNVAMILRPWTATRQAHKFIQWCDLHSYITTYRARPREKPPQDFRDRPSHRTGACFSWALSSRWKYTECSGSASRERVRGPFLFPN